MIAPKKTKTVGSYEAKTHLPSLLKEVASGREIVITRRDKPVARLVPIDRPGTNSDIYDRIVALHGRIKLPKGETGRDLIQAGRKL
jgi:prevent-host-death family protein